MDLLHLETDRLILRCVTNEDKFVLFDMLKNEEIANNCGINPLVRVEQAERLIRNWNESAELKEGVRWGITLKECGTFIGTVGIRFGHGRRREIGYHLHPLYWKKGYMREAICKVLDYGFNMSRFNHLIATVMETNIPSIRLLEKIGFQQESVLKNYVNGENALVYSITSDVYSLRTREKATF